MNAAITGIEYHLPPGTLTNAELATRYPDWTVDRIANKTGIEQRHIAGSGECSSDLAYSAAQKLFSSGVCKPNEIDYILLCTQSPDYFLPTTACILQDRLDIPSTAGALDYNLGCSGYVYGLGIAQGLIATHQASKILLLTAETYSKFLDPVDRSAVTIFGDGAAATLVSREPATTDSDFPASFYVYGTNGKGAEHLMVQAGGLRNPNGSCRQDGAGSLYMNGPEILRFTLRAVPDCINQLLAKSGRRLNEVDLFIFHQANHYMLESLRQKLSIEKDRFYIHIRECGNTVSSTIPIALKHAITDGRLRNGQTVMLVGFGVGLSWGATLMQWPFLGTAAT